MTKEERFDCGNCWSVTSVKGPIANSKESDDITAVLGFPHPTMTFPANRVTISNGHFHITVDTTEALRCIAKKSPEDIKVMHSQQAYWQDKQKQYRLELDFDWTYQSPYCGTITGGSESSSSMTLDYGRLKVHRAEDILFYDENVLYEDEMGDNGSSKFTVKTRVMAFGIFMLIRSFIRVDGVTFKSLETRIFVDYAKPSMILKETRVKQQAFDEVYAVLGKAQYREDNVVADRLTILSISTTAITPSS